MISLIILNFKIFLQRLQNTSLQNPSQQTPSQNLVENTFYQPQSPPIYQGSNSKYDDEPEETVPESP